MDKLIIVGTSTNARHVYEFVKYYNLYDVVGFAVNEQYKDKETFKGLPVYSLEKLDEEFGKSEVLLYVALLWNRLNADRKELFNSLKKDGWNFANLISPSAKIRGQINGSNIWIHDDVVIQNDTVINENCAIMAMSLVGANCEISKHCFLGAKSTVGGGTIIGEQTFVGMNCTVFDNTLVGKKCILGACTAVKRNVPDCSVYKTSSNFEIKQYDESVIEEKLLFKKNKRDSERND